MKQCALHAPSVLVCSCGYVEPALAERARRCDDWSQRQLEDGWKGLGQGERDRFRADLQAYKDLWGPDYASGDELEGVRYAMSMALSRAPLSKKKGRGKR